jgi:hypothetical protein
MIMLVKDNILILGPVIASSHLSWSISENLTHDVRYSALIRKTLKEKTHAD